ncbi:MAG: hypothetical protein K6F56_09185 [Oscillospiraceae bacterium]|nr:hypothetical protein [Oscillospiraceae bacterium]
MSIRIENARVFGWEAAIRGARNPRNSWAESDSRFYDFADGGIHHYHTLLGEHAELSALAAETRDGTRDLIGPKDYRLLMNQSKGGSEESKWRRMIHVQMDMTAPLYWWKEFDTYKVGTVSNSCSTMQMIHAKAFTADDFSCEHLLGEADGRIEAAGEKRTPAEVLRITIDMLNAAREAFLETQDKQYWWQLIQLLPSSYNQRRTIDLNYEVLRGQYRERKDHKLDEWRTYCAFVRDLPYSEFITLNRP